MKLINKLFDLTNRIIVVAGGAGQIGFSFCEILADAGAKIIIADIDLEMANQKIDALTDTNIQSNINAIKLDVSNPENISAFYQYITTEYGKIYGLINCFHFKGNTRKLDTNASFFSGIEDYPIEAWDIVHDINLRGTFLMTQGAIPLFKSNGIGVIINISSTYGNVSANKSIYGNSGINSPVAYATSKAAIINLTRYTATHLAEFNIRANTLSPGGVYNNQSSEFVTNYTNLTPLKRMANPEDYQGAILFMMSDASGYMTGANLNVDGGWTAW
jgi:NAD(P)-dependent dehydrogenase (short-subunit alcohol dehydrogenase family)